MLSDAYFVIAIQKSMWKYVTHWTILSFHVLTFTP